MTLLSVDTFEGKAEINGVVRDVSFSCDTLRVDGVSIYEAVAILKLLSTGSSTPGAAALVAEVINKQGESDSAVAANATPSDAPVQESVAEKTTTPPPKRRGRKKKAEAVESVEEMAAQAKEMAAQAKEPQLEEDEVEVSGSPDEPETPADPLEEDASIEDDSVDVDDVNDVAAPTGGASSDDDKLKAELSLCATLRDAVTLFEDNGFTTIDEIMAAATKYKSSCPVLQRIDESKFEVRIKRTAAALGISKN